MHFHKSCTSKGDHLILLINTGNAHQEKMWSQNIINTFKKCEGDRDQNRMKNDSGDQKVVVFAITEINYLMVGLVSDLERPLSYLYFWY